MIHQATIGTLWKTAIVRAHVPVGQMLCDEKWKDFSSGTGIKHCRYVISLWRFRGLSE